MAFQYYVTIYHHRYSKILSERPTLHLPCYQHSHSHLLHERKDTWTPDKSHPSKRWERRVFPPWEENSFRLNGHGLLTAEEEVCWHRCNHLLPAVRSLDELYQWTRLWRYALQCRFLHSLASMQDPSYVQGPSSHIWLAPFSFYLLRLRESLASSKNRSPRGLRREHHISKFLDRHMSRWG